MHPSLPGLTELSCGQCATLACLLEVIAPKPGNVHRGADFEDLRFSDLAVSAVLIGPTFDQAAQRPVGQTVREAVRATRSAVVTNSNLGMILLLSPLAAVPPDVPLRAGIPQVLDGLTAADAIDVYEAIRLANPGGLGRSKQMDVADAPPADLRAAMALAQHRDRVARQYVTGFEDVFERVVPWLQAGRSAGWTLTTSIVHAHVQLMACVPDSLVARKCGNEIARQAQLRAGRVLEAGSPGEEDYEREMGELDFWLRSDGHRRNPGTTADLIAAGLFVGLRERWLPPPWL